MRLGKNIFKGALEERVNLPQEASALRCRRVELGFRDKALAEITRELGSTYTQSTLAGAAIASPRSCSSNADLTPLWFQKAKSARSTRGTIDGTTTEKVDKGTIPSSIHRS